MVCLVLLFVLYYSLCCIIVCVVLLFMLYYCLCCIIVCVVLLFVLHSSFIMLNFSFLFSLCRLLLNCNCVK